MFSCWYNPGRTSSGYTTGMPTGTMFQAPWFTCSAKLYRLRTDARKLLELIFWFGMVSGKYSSKRDEGCNAESTVANRVLLHAVVTIADNLSNADVDSAVYPLVRYILPQDQYQYLRYVKGQCLITLRSSSLQLRERLNMAGRVHYDVRVELARWMR